MFVLNNYLLGLICIHLFWCYFYLVGSLAWCDDAKADSARHSTGESHADVPPLTDMVITSVTGVAITGFFLFLLAVVGLLNVYALILGVLLPCLCFHYVRRENVFGRAFWQRRFERLRTAASVPAFIIYVVLLALAVPAVLPPTLADSVSYHLAYAVDFANAGYLTVDEFLRYPYYTNNWLLLDALMLILKLDSLPHFLTWLSGLLTCLGIYGFLSERLNALPQTGTAWRRVLSLKHVLVVLALVISPLFLRYLNVAYVDVPIGLFMLVAFLCVYHSLSRNGTRYKYCFILTAAFLVGMKISHVLLLPLLLISLAILLLRERREVSRLLLPCLAFLILSSPWYVRNTIGAGDPLSPTLNLYFRGHDPIFSAQDYQSLMSDLRTAKDLRALASLPVRLFRDPTSRNFREYGVTLIVALLYLPFASLLLLAFKRFRQAVGFGFVYLNVTVVYLILIWANVSSLGRYFLHIFPLYACYIGACVNGLAAHFDLKLRRGSAARIASESVVVGLLLLLLLPSPVTSLYFYEDLLMANYRYLPKRLRNRKDYLRQNFPGYASTQLIVSTLKGQRMEDRRVLALGFESLAFYFRRNQIVSLGDWFGPGRYADLIAKTDKGELASYLNDFKIGAVRINLHEKRLPDATYELLKKQLRENNFVRTPPAEGSTEIYIKAGRENAP